VQGVTEELLQVQASPPNQDKDTKPQEGEMPFMKISDSPERPQGVARRGFLRRAGTMATGGLAAAALPKPMTGAPEAPVLSQAGARPGEPYFFCIPAVKEV
jgi:hypothetical protein